LLNSKTAALRRVGFGATGAHAPAAPSLPSLTFGLFPFYQNEVISVNVLDDTVRTVADDQVQLSDRLSAVLTQVLLHFHRLLEVTSGIVPSSMP
jgi:hypothetical protein